MRLRTLFSSRRRTVLAMGGALVVIAQLSLGWYFSLHPLKLTKELLRIALDAAGSVAYRGDLGYVETATRSYMKGTLPPGQGVGQWQKLAARNPGFRVLHCDAPKLPCQVPFVYQAPEEPYLVKFQEQYRMRELAQSGKDEYDGMLRVFRWIGTRWDHGADPVTGGNNPLDPVSAIEGGERGERYWCEIAAKVTVEAASALGWPARLVTLSRDGYSWDHAVAEVWSNRFNKWFAVDTDFNVIYEARGVPLSAFELCHIGVQLQRQGKLRQLRFAPRKPSLREADLVPFYRYVHIDLRSDWNTRRLRNMSPAGGDLSTWYTARRELGPILTAKRRVDLQAVFDWKMNQVLITPLRLEKGSSGSVRALSLALATYSPQFDFFEIDGNGKSYRSRNGRVTVAVREGVNVVSVRTVDREGRRGPVYQVRFAYR